MEPFKNSNKQEEKAERNKKNNLEMLDFDKLLPQMLKVAKRELKGGYKDARDFAEVEFKKLLENAELLARKVAAGEITPERAKRHIRMSKNAAEAVLLTVEGIGLDAAETAINGAIDAVRVAVNKALPVPIL